VSEANTFTGARLDRAGDARRRDPDWVAAQRAHPAARAVLAGDEGVVLDGDRLAYVPLADALATWDAAPIDAARHEATSSAAREPLLLGVDGVGPLFAVDVDAPPPAGQRPARPIAGGLPRGSGAERPARAPGPRPVALREAAAVLPQDEGGLVAYAAALLNWHRRHGFCAACGNASELGEAGLVRICPRCGTHHHPRTDPVVIMLVTDGARLLLGRAPRWPARRYSALAGFVEPGESLEEAVVREVAEESGVRAGPPRYVASQPWPFPTSLMLGFIAPWVAGEPAPQEDEIEDVRWFDRAEVAAAADQDLDGWGGSPDPADPDSTSLLLPPRLAIARRLIERWLAT
jgi:NAD+ diphosphatase